MFALLVILVAAWGLWDLVAGLLLLLQGILVLLYGLVFQRGR